MTRLASTVVLIGVLATGCTTSPTPLPTPVSPPVSTSTTVASPSPQPTTTATPAPRPTIAPQVTRTLDIRKFEDRPCDLITSAQATALGLQDLKPQSESIQCKWQGAGNRSLTVQVATKFNPLVRAYQDSNSRPWDVFEPMALAGQPALKRAASPDMRFGCLVDISTGPTSGIKIDGADHEPQNKPCDQAVKAAEFIVRNLGG